MSGGRLKIRVYGGGELIPPLESFEAVSNGAIEMGHGGAYYWAGKTPATQFFSTVPFGMNVNQINAWIITGGGRELWEDLYDPFDLMPISVWEHRCSNGWLVQQGNKHYRGFTGIENENARAGWKGSGQSGCNRPAGGRWRNLYQP